MLLGRLRVRQKLVLLVVPLLLLAVAGAVPLVVGRIQAAERSAESAALVQRAVRIGELVQELQQERLASLGYLSGNVLRERVIARSARVLELARQLETDYSAGDDRLALQLRQVRLRSGLDGLRPQILERRTAGIAVYIGFTGVIGELIDVLRLTDNADLSGEAGRQQLALDAIIRHDEASAAEGAALFVEPGRRITLRVVGLVGAGLALENREEGIFKELASTSAAELYENVEGSPSSIRLNNYMEGLAGSNTTEIAATVAPELLPQVESLTSLSRLVETRAAAQAVAEADRSARTDRWLAGVVGGIALALLIAAALLSVLITRSIARPLRRLTASADEVADVAQQELVRVADTDDPQAAVPKLRPVRVGTSDELGELAKAFNRVQQVAANLVERQLVSRRNVATMFGNVGRRTQNLVGRQLAMIDSLERNEQDPALLDRLYRLDHVSTRLRRNANSLVVLSGATEQQITSEPLTVADTIRSALGEIEGFQRVRLGSIDQALLTPDVTPDVILLLAELLENGTSFSPPHTEVDVDARSVADGGVQIRIVDHGLGMTTEQLEAENRRLVSRERLDLAPTDVLGLFVVGRLARRHGIDVVLGPTPGTGVTADVRIPPENVVSSDRRAVAPAAPAAAVEVREPATAGGAPATAAVPEGERGWWDGPRSRAGAPAAGPDAPERDASPAAGGDGVGPNGSGRPAEPRDGPVGGARSAAPVDGPVGLNGAGRPAAPGDGAGGVDGGVRPPAPGEGAGGVDGGVRPAAPGAGAVGGNGPGPVGDVPAAGAGGIPWPFRANARPAARPAQPAHDQADQATRNGVAPNGAAPAQQPAGDLPAGEGQRPRGAAGMVRRRRGAQHPDTGVRPEPQTYTPPSADEARQNIEDFEAGVRRALRETGADRGTGFVVEDGGAAPWTDLDADDAGEIEQTRALVEEFEDDVRRALARLDEFAARPIPKPGTLFERRPTGPVPRQSVAGQGSAVLVQPSPEPPRPVPPQPVAEPRGPVPPQRPAESTGGPRPAAEPAPPPPPAEPRRLRTGAEAPPEDPTTVLERPDPRPLERRPPAAAGADPTRPGADPTRPGADPTRAGADERPEPPTAPAPPVAPPQPASPPEPEAAAPTAPRDAATDAAPGKSEPDDPAGGADDAGTGEGRVARDRAPALPGTDDASGEGAGTGPSAASRTNDTSPNGSVPNPSDVGKMDPPKNGLVRRVPGAQMPAGARAARPGIPAPAPTDAAEQDAAAARSLVEEFEAGVRRALQEAPRTATTDEDGVR